MMRAREAAASETSDSVMPPTPLAMTLTDASSVPILDSESRSASALPCTSALTMRLTNWPAFSPSCEKTSSTFLVAPARRTSRYLPWRYKRDFTCLALALDDQQVVAGARRVRQAEHLHGLGRTGRLHLLAQRVEQRTHAAELLARDDRIARLERAALHQHGRDRAAALLDAGLEHDAHGEAGGRRLEVEHFGLQQHGFEQLVDALAGLAPRR